MTVSLSMVDGNVRYFFGEQARAAHAGRSAAAREREHAGGRHGRKRSSRPTPGSLTRPCRSCLIGTGEAGRAADRGGRARFAPRESRRHELDVASSRIAAAGVQPYVGADRGGLCRTARATCTDEVIGPGETQWIAIEDHPKLAEIVEEMEAPVTVHEEDSGLDLNALIDVCLVLLDLLHPHHQLRDPGEGPADAQVAARTIPAA